MLIDCLNKNLAKIKIGIVRTNSTNALKRACQPALERVPNKLDVIEISNLPNRIGQSSSGLKSKIITIVENTEIYKSVKKIIDKHNTVLQSEHLERLLTDFKDYRTKNGDNLYVKYKEELASIIQVPSNLSEYCYHGTSEDAAKSIISNGFDSRKQSKSMGSLTRDLGQGIYLSPNKKFAKDFGAKVLTVKLDASKIGHIEHKDWLEYYNKLSSILFEYRKVKNLTGVESNALQNQLFPHYISSGIKVGNKEIKLGGLSTNGMMDAWDVINLRKFLNIPSKNSMQIAIYDPAIIKDIK